MSTTVGATLASSKLAVTQDDLHLVGSNVDHLIVQFDQMAFDELLAADQIKAGKRRCPETRETAIGAAASSSSTGSALSSNNGSIHAATPSRTHQPAKGKKVSWGSLNRRHSEPQGSASRSRRST